MSIRITGLQEVATLQSGDFVAVDNTTTGTHKFDATKLGAGIEANLAPTYSSAATYDIGDFCMYNGVMYKCTTAITSPENWTASHWTQTSAGVALADKVDKVSGKGLSENDFTNALKTKLDGIQAGAEANVQADWAQTNTGADDYIKNKPTDATTTTAGLMSASDKAKLNGIQAGAEVNVQADWNEDDSSADDYIKNKPSTATESTNGLMSSADKAKLDGIASGAEVNVQADWAQTNTSAEDYIKNKPTAATESTTGLMSAADKAKLDSIEQGAEVNVQADWAQTNMSADDYIKNKPVDATESVGGLMSAEDKAKLDGIESGAQVNVIDGVKVDGVALAPDANKDVDIVGKANQASIAEQYSTTATYVYDDYVIYDNTLYRCIADTSGTWDASDWEAVNIGDELEHKANIDGAYDDMTVGNAEQLVSSVAINEHQPYNFRPSGGSVDIGDRKTEEIVGGSLAWNQLVENGNFASTDGWAYSNVSISASNNVLTATVTTASSDQNVRRNIGANVNGHKCFICADVQVSENTTTTQISGLGDNKSFALSANVKTTVESIVNVNAQNASFLIYGNRTGTGLSVGSTFSVSNAMLIDLTTMFGSTIADYIYTLEQATPGAGVARFRKYFPKPYYAYDAGSLQSVNLRSGVMTELNQWDEEWEVGTINASGANQTDGNRIRSKNYIPVVPNATYHCSSSYQYTSNIWCYGYDANKNPITNAFNGTYWRNINKSTFTIPENVYYIRIIVVDTTYNHDICINLHWDGEYDGVYEPYITHTYQYDPDLELRGIPKLDENNYLTYDGDVYESDGMVTRKYGETTISMDDGSYVSSIDALLVYSSYNYFANAKAPSANNVAFNAVADKVMVTSASAINSGSYGIGINTTKDIYLKVEGCSSKVDYQSKFPNGIKVTYELATPTTEQADPYTNPQIVNDFGTESFIDSLVEAGTRDVSIPVGHNTKYLANLKAKLEMAPNSPAGDGKYIVQQTDGMNYYVNFEPEIANKANVDGAYEDMTVGNAEQLLASVYTEDQIPYNFRQSGGGISVGDREIDKVVGGTVAWNQLVQNGNFASSNGWTSGSGVSSMSIANNKATLTFNTSTLYNHDVRGANVTFVNGHKYLMSADFTTDTNIYYAHIDLLNNDNALPAIGNKRIDSSKTVCGIFAPTNTYANCSVMYRFGEIEITSGNTGVVSNCVIFDLTQMFGSTIADYIYTLETTNAGDGVAWFRNLFPDPYYAYDAGSLQSVNTSAHSMVGFNQWDEEWELGDINGTTGQPQSDNTKIRTKNYIPVLPNTNYYCKGVNTGRIFYYDSNKDFISSSYWGASTVKTTPQNCCFMKFIQDSTTTYNHDICINLSHNGSRDGEYEPYVKHTYPLDSSLTLRGIPKLDSSNRLYYDGDEYSSDGTVNIKWAELTNQSGAIGDTITLTGCDPSATDIITSAGHLADVGTLSGTTLTLTKALSGASIVYPLETPTTETATTYQNPQVVNDWGTEEYVDYAYIQGTRDVAVPVGHYTEYLPNLRDKLQSLPDAAGSNGTYVIEQTGGQMALTPLTTPREIPDVPTSTDGTFALQATVSGGAVTYAWVSAT